MQPRFLWIKQVILSYCLVKLKVIYNVKLIHFSYIWPAMRFYLGFALLAIFNDSLDMKKNNMVSSNYASPPTCIGVFGAFWVCSYLGYPKGSTQIWIEVNLLSTWQTTLQSCPRLPPWPNVSSLIENSWLFSSPTLHCLLNYINHRN